MLLAEQSCAFKRLGVVTNPKAGHAVDCPLPSCKKSWVVRPMEATCSPVGAADQDRVLAFNNLGAKPDDAVPGAKTIIKYASMTMQQTIDALEGEHELAGTEQRAMLAGYLEENVKRGVQIRRFPLGAGSSQSTGRASAGQLLATTPSAKTQAIAKESLAALTGQIAKVELQKMASKSADWKRAAQEGTERLDAAKQETEEAKQEQALLTERVAMLEASIRAQKQEMEGEAAAAAAALRSQEQQREAGSSNQSASGAGKGGGGTPSSRSNASMTAFEVIEDIRKGKLLDVEMPAELKDSVESLRQMCGRGLEKLSKDLYNHESHFFNELLQNCDDNAYAVGTNPTVKVVVSSTAVVLLNNEAGP